jgi:hypothetical protein
VAIRLIRLALRPCCCFAIDEFELASKAKDGDFYLASVVDARLRALRREAADQQKPGFGQAG